MLDLLEQHGALPYGDMLTADDDARMRGKTSEDRETVLADIRQRAKDGTLMVKNYFP
jgi:hypothetical protein